ncbi:MAG TPA: ankyrin repeat domain-containing protein [Thermoanaerobaculia bacterium]|jgi:hypothetical protein|nr:ankyrin repeat domain-containing protein [Thermoanaerobaculia bacterium]
MRSVIALVLLAASASFIGAVRSGNVAEVRQMLARGADPNAPEGVNEWTPLLHAVHKNQPGSVAALLDGHADPNRAVNGMTPLMMAAGYRYTPIVRLLLAHGADPRIQGLDGETAVDYAVIGMTDIDRFTFFSCGDETVHAILAAHAPRTISRAARRWGMLKRCSSLALLQTR